MPTLNVEKRIPGKNHITLDDRMLSYDPKDQDIYCEGFNDAIDQVTNNFGVKK